MFLDGVCTLACDKEACLAHIRSFAGEEEIIPVNIMEPIEWDKICRCLEDAEAIVLAADVHMDSVSAHVLSFLEKIEQAVIAGESIRATFYAVLYTELYEGEQTSIAMGVLKNFCVHANITWGRGLGIGGNGVKPAVRRKFFGKRSLDFRIRPLQVQALYIKERARGKDFYINPLKVSRNRYIRKINHEGRKNNRIKIAQN